MSEYLFVSEVFINQTKGYSFGESDVYETSCRTKGELYKEMQREYGRCTSKVYVDTSDGTKQVGWVFEKKMLYEDWNRGRYKERPNEDDYYIREVWVRVHTALPTKTVEYHALYWEAT